jgi:hypothetical protein
LKGDGIVGSGRFLKKAAQKLFFNLGQGGSKLPAHRGRPAAFFKKRLLLALLTGSAVLQRPDLLVCAWRPELAFCA